MHALLALPFRPLYRATTLPTHIYLPVGVSGRRATSCLSPLFARSRRLSRTLHKAPLPLADEPRRSSGRSQAAIVIDFLAVFQKKFMKIAGNLSEQIGASLTRWCKFLKLAYDSSPRPRVPSQFD